MNTDQGSLGLRVWRRTRWLLAGIIVLSVGAACTHPTGTFDHSRSHLYTSDSAGNFKFQELGPVTVRKSSFIWTSCDTLASQVGERLLDRSKQLDGNALMNVRWMGENGWTRVPTCEKQWGWFILYVLPGFGPWAMSATAEAVMIKADVKALEKTTN